MKDELMRQYEASINEWENPELAHPIVILLDYSEYKKLMAVAAARKMTINSAAEDIFTDGLKGAIT